MRKTAIIFVINIILGGMSVPAADRSRPNFVVIFADDLGMGDLGSYRALHAGGESDQPQSYKYTPSLDRLAREGIRFSRAYATSWCAPSRQMLLSGQWANRPNAYDYPWIGSTLREQGYVTGMVGKSHGARPTGKVFGNRDPKTAEFDDGLFFNGGARDFYMQAGETLPGRINFKEAPFQAEGGEYLTDVFTDRAVEFIARHAASARPFMLYLAHLAPHSPLHGKPMDMRKLFPETFGDMSDAEIRATGWQEGRGGKYDAHHYAAMVYALDRSVARIMEVLEKGGVADNTMVLFTSDNGAIHGSNHPYTGHKWDMFEGGIRVPMILWSSGIARSGRAGSVYDGLASLADVAPTLYAAATNQAYPHPTDGINLLPYALGVRPLPEGRRFFWANSTNPSLRQRLTGFDRFKPESDHKKIVQSVLVQDRDKIVRWRIPDSHEIGAVYKHLPDACGQSNPVETLAEEAPRAGELPESVHGRKLLAAWRELISAGDLVEDWSGVKAMPLAETESTP